MVSPNRRVHFHSVLNIADSAISEDELYELPRDPYMQTAHRRACDVEFDPLPQEAVEAAIRKDIDHISSIFGVSVGFHLLKAYNIVFHIEY